MAYNPYRSAFPAGPMFTLPNGIVLVPVPHSLEFKARPFDSKGLIAVEPDPSLSSYSSSRPQPPDSPSLQQAARVRRLRIRSRLRASGLLLPGFYHDMARDSNPGGIDLERRNKEPRPLESMERQKLEEFVDAISYSARYSDDDFEYRHVQLPKAMLKVIPREYFDSSRQTLKLLWEEEWRGLGITQSLGWEHYETHEPEPHILLFKRPINFQA